MPNLTLNNNLMMLKVDDDDEEGIVLTMSNPPPLTNETGAPKLTVDSSDKSPPQKPAARRPQCPTSIERCNTADANNLALFIA
ncbi:hypothetical protein EVAR_72387_1 [Eumeta japonica]|uniref:Uncharacterized protein n=1 Tax=Eumeta variegata TaxID=151549 RepID=A0A4C1TJB9_EUMVA|nr:hypothetical protein EVAR_72387_1 [Eumeta japonica]